MYQSVFQRWQILDAEAVVQNLARGHEQLEVAAIEHRTVECHPGDALTCGIAVPNHDPHATEERENL